MKAYAIINLTDFGYALNGEHFYADVTVYVDDNHMGNTKISQIMDEGLAERLNKKDGTDYYEVGDPTPRFEGAESAINKSLEEIKLRWPFIKNVFMGSMANPSKCVMCEDEELMREINNIAEAYEKCYKKTCDPWAAGLADVIDPLYDEWDKILKIIE